MVRIALLVLTLSVLACASAPAVRRFEPGDRAAIAGVLDAQAAAWNRGDLTGYMDGYDRSDDLVFTSGGNVRKGWQAAFDSYQKRYATDPAAMGKLKFEVTSIDAIGGEGAVVLGTWDLTGSPHDGRGVFSLVFVRRPAGWKIVHDHTSSAPAPAPEPAP